MFFVSDTLVVEGFTCPVSGRVVVDRVGTQHVRYRAGVACRVVVGECRYAVGAGGFEQAVTEVRLITVSDGFPRRQRHVVRAGRGGARVVERRLPLTGLEQDAPPQTIVGLPTEHDVVRPQGWMPDA